MNKFIEIDHDALDIEIQQAAEQRIMACLDALDAEGEGAEVDWSFAAAPYDGCSTCDVREILSVGIPMISKVLKVEALREAAEYLRSTQAPDLSMNQEYADWLVTRTNEMLVAEEDFASDAVVIPFARP